MNNVYKIGLHRLHKVCIDSWPRGYKAFLMLNSAETRFYLAHKC